MKSGFFAFLAVTGCRGPHFARCIPVGRVLNPCPVPMCGTSAAVLQDATPRSRAPVARDPRPASAAVLLDEPPAAGDPRPAPVAVGVIPYYI